LKHLQNKSCLGMWSQGKSVGHYIRQLQFNHFET
jgi:hypothetical protein